MGYLRIPLHRAGHGFTLMELLIAIAIMGILAAVALPNYRNYVLRSNRPVAKGLLIDVVAKQEAYRLQTRGYADSFDDLFGSSFAGTTLYLQRNGKLTSAVSSDSSYSISLLSGPTIGCPSTATAAATTVVAIEARAVQKQLADSSCRRFLLCFEGSKSAQDASGTTSAAINQTCWE